MRSITGSSAAVALAEQVRDAYRGAGQRRAEDVAKVEQWLAEHPPG